jgi:Uma2 family endonuclease
MERTIERLLTADDLYAMPAHGGRHELVKGEIKPMSPAGAQHGKIALRIGRFIGNFVAEQRLGEVYAAETGFTIAESPDTVRAPDVAFVAQERIPSEGEPEGFWSIAPDLVVEVVSPWDRMADVQAKITDYLRAGVRMVWLVDPHTETVTVYQSLTQMKILLAEDTLTGEDILPGFSVPVADLFT